MKDYEKAKLSRARYYLSLARSRGVKFTHRQLNRFLNSYDAIHASINDLFRSVYANHFYLNEDLSEVLFKDQTDLIKNLVYTENPIMRMLRKTNEAEVDGSRWHIPIMVGAASKALSNEDISPESAEACQKNEGAQQLDP